MAEQGLRRKLVGTVVSNRMEKTAVVQVERLAKHPQYQKYVRRRAKYMVHDPNNSCRIGDKVRIIESRAWSRRKRWQLLAVVEKSQLEMQ